MKQKNKTLKIALSILIVVLISLISFGGIFVKDKNKMKNILPEYKFGMDFSGARIINIKPDDTVNTEYYDKDGNKVESSAVKEEEKDQYTTKDIPVNSEEVLNKENFDKTKKIIEDRLRISDVKEYEIRENSSNGEIYISIPENDYTDDIISQINTIGDFKITDSEDESNVLLTGNQIKDVKVGMSAQATGNVIVMSIQFDKEGTKKLQEISKIYTGEEVLDANSSEKNKTDEENTESAENGNEAKEENNEDTTPDSTKNTTKKQVKLILDGQTLLTTEFPEEVKDGMLQLSVGGSSSTSDTSDEDLKKSLKQASSLAVLLKTDSLPIEYKLDNNLNTKSEINKDKINQFIIAGVIVLALFIIYAIVRYKKDGLLAMISLIGYIGLLLITLRYANVVLTITGLAAIALSVILSYVFLINVLKEDSEEKAFGKVAIRFLTIYVPSLIISIVFSFSKNLSIASFGMITFYSIIIMLIYHGVITKSLIDKSENK